MQVKRLAFRDPANIQLTFWGLSVDLTNPKGHWRTLEMLPPRSKRMLCWYKRLDGSFKLSGTDPLHIECACRRTPI